jgi:hypothetical protein
MKKVRTFLVLLAISGLSISSVNAQFAGGNGSGDDPYQIATAAQLAQLATFVNDGNTAYNNKYYILNNDIDLSDYQTGAGWMLIGNYAKPSPENRVFKGNFDGANKKITGLKLNNTTLEYAGLFGCVDGGTIQNLGVEGTDIASSFTTTVAGGVAGFIDKGTMSNCYSTGTVSSSSDYAYAGGVVGGINNNSKISNCYSTMAVSSFASVTSAAGGVVTFSEDNCTISNCYSTGTINSSATSSNSYAGGVVAGIDKCTVSNCYSTGTVNSTTASTAALDFSYVGGVVGVVDKNSAVSNCYSTGVINSTTTAAAAAAGGITASIGNNSSISNCYSTGTVSSSSSSGSSGAGGVAGGIVSASTISNCYATGEINNTAPFYSFAGGVSGFNLGGEISNCAALNSRINCTNVGFGRITGNSSGTLKNNIAFNRMLNPSGNTTWDKIGLTSEDGADITAQAIGEDGTLGGRFSPDKWTTENGYLPGLDGKTVQMPPHLRYNALPPIITKQPQDVTIVVNGTAILSVEAKAGDGGTLSYQWYSNTTNSNTDGTLIPGAASAIYSPSTAMEGTFYYYVVVTNKIENNGNGGNLLASIASNAVTLKVTTTGIDDISINVRIYPNPTNGQLTIENGQLKIENVEIFDVMGREVQSSKFNVQSSEFLNFKSETLNISDLSAGIYFLRIQTENGVITKKIIKQ